MKVNIMTRVLKLNLLISIALSIMAFSTYGAEITVKSKQFSPLKNSSISQPGEVNAYSNSSYMDYCFIAGFSMTTKSVYFPSDASPLTTIDGYTGFLTPEGLLIVLSGGTLRVSVSNASNNPVSTGLNFGSQGQITLYGEGVKTDNACWTIDMGGHNTRGGSLNANVNVSIYVPKNVLPGVYPLPTLWVGKYGMVYEAGRSIVDSSDIITVRDTSPKCTVNIPGTIDFGTITSQSSSSNLLEKKDGNINYQCTGENSEVDVTMRATSTSQKENNNTLYLVKNGTSTILARLQGVIGSAGSNECDASGKRISFDGSPISLGSFANNNSGHLPISWLLCTPVAGINDFGSGKATATLEFDWK